jgi:hypothetical protein
MRTALSIVVAIAVLTLLMLLRESEPMREAACVDVGSALDLGCGGRR